MDFNRLALDLFNSINSFTGNLGLTIIIISVLSRVMLLPFTLSTLRYAKKMQSLKPKLDELKEKYKDDRRKHMEEQTRLMREENLNPLAGCLPIVVQFVMLIFLYQVLSQFLNSGHNTSFFWFDLSKPDVLPLQGLPFGIQLPGLLVASTAITTFINAKMTFPSRVDQPKTTGSNDFSQAMQTQSLYVFPLMTLLFGSIWPSGLALYWTVSTLVDIIQRYFVSGPGGLKDWARASSIARK